MMKVQRNNLTNDIMGNESEKRIACTLGHQRLILCQKNTIEALKKEVSKLWQYIQYIRSVQEKCTEKKENPESKSTTIDNNESLKSIHQTIEKQIHEFPVSKKIISLKSVLNQVMEIVEAERLIDVVPKVKEMKIKAEEKAKPVFIEKIKEKQVPIYIEIPSQEKQSKSLLQKSNDDLMSINSAVAVPSESNLTPKREEPELIIPKRNNHYVSPKSPQFQKSRRKYQDNKHWKSQKKVQYMQKIQESKSLW